MKGNTIDINVFSYRLPVSNSKPNILYIGICDSIKTQFNAYWFLSLNVLIA